MASRAVEIMQYTEEVIYDDSGEEVARWRNYDDHWYDTEGTYELTEQERADYLPAADEED